MGRNKSPNQGGPTADQKGIAENTGLSNSLEDFGGGKGQAAGMQESPQAEDQFDEDVMQVYDENDTEPKATPRPPYDYFEKGREGRG